MKLNDFEIFKKKQFLISELQRFYREEGFVPNRDMMNPKYKYPGFWEYTKWFDTFNNALKEAKLKINQIHRKLDGTETCFHCDKRANEIVGFIGWYYNKSDDNKRHCNRCGNSRGIFEHKKGTLDINTSTGRGRAGEITVVKALKIGDEHDCARLSCGYPFDLYHKEEYKKINVKTSVLSNKYNKWMFNFNTGKVADTYICLGMSFDTKQIKYVWVVSNENKIRNQEGFGIYNTQRSLFTHEKWEVDAKIYDDAWQEMLKNFHDDKCGIYSKKVI